MYTIAVLFGGKSVEHDISIITALQTMKNLKKYKVIPIYISADGRFITGDNLSNAKTYLNFDRNAKNLKEVNFKLGCGQIDIIKHNKIKQTLKVDCALLCNHGNGGEDGSLQGLLELAEIPYTSCKVASSAICMDKALSKIVFSSKNIKSPAYVHFDICQYKAKKFDILKSIIDKIGCPCIIKPARLGSSVGIGICEDVKKLESCIEEAFLYDNKIIVEKYIVDAREFCCGALKIGEKIVLGNVQEVSKSKIYTFSEKYLSSKTVENKKIAEDLEHKIKKLAEKTYRALECDGVIRVDFLYDEKQEVLYVNEVNTIPGSLAFNLFPFPFSDLLNAIIVEAIEYHQKKRGLIYTFNSEAIKAYIDMTDHMVK